MLGESDDEANRASREAGGAGARRGSRRIAPVTASNTARIRVDAEANLRRRLFRLPLDPVLRGLFKFPFSFKLPDSWKYLIGNSHADDVALIQRRIETFQYRSSTEVKQ